MNHFQTGRPESSQPRSAPVGQRAQCPYCGFPVPVRVHASVHVTVARFINPPSGEFCEKTTCPTCHKVCWTSWTINQSHGLGGLLRNIFG